MSENVEVIVEIVGWFCVIYAGEPEAVFALEDDAEKHADRKYASRRNVQIWEITHKVVPTLDLTKANAELICRGLV